MFPFIAPGTAPLVLRRSGSVVLLRLFPNYTSAVRIGIDRKKVVFKLFVGIKVEEVFFFVSLRVHNVYASMLGRIADFLLFGGCESVVGVVNNCGHKISLYLNNSKAVRLEGKGPTALALTKIVRTFDLVVKGVMSLFLCKVPICPGAVTYIRIPVPVDCLCIGGYC
jgi:hypothetical protein